MAQREVQAALLDVDSAAHAIPELDERYIYRDREEVRAYLMEHPGLVNLLREADHEIAQRFGEQTLVVMDVIDDPDVIGECTLFGLIRTSLAPQDALDLLHRLDQEWWIQRSAGVQDQLALSLEFV